MLCSKILSFSSDKNSIQFLCTGFLYASNAYISYTFFFSSRPFISFCIFIQKKRISFTKFSLIIDSSRWWGETKKKKNKNGGKIKLISSQWLFHNLLAFILYICGLSNRRCTFNIKRISFQHTYYFFWIAIRHTYLLRDLCFKFLETKRLSNWNFNKHQKLIRING